MGWMTAAEAAREWGVTPRRVQILCAEGRVAGAERFGRAWRIPEGAPKCVSSSSFEQNVQ